MKVDFPDHVLDRAHRVGKPKTLPDGTVLPTPIIAKFWNFNLRTKIYQARKVTAPTDQRTVRLDLTWRRRKLIAWAQNRVKDNKVANVDFIFANINCSPSLRLKNGKYLLFNTKYELIKQLPQMARPDGDDDDEEFDDDAGGTAAFARGD